MIIAGADNRSPMLEKSLYDSWKSRMEFYMENRDNGRIILDSVQNGPLVWPTITEDDGTTRKRLMLNFLLLKSKLIAIAKLPMSFFKVFHRMWLNTVSVLLEICSTHQQHECYQYVNETSSSEYKVSEQSSTRMEYQDPLEFVTNYHQSPSQLNNYHSQYNSTQFPQQSYMVLQVQSSQPYSQMYPPHHPSQPPISHSSVPLSQQYQSHQTASVPQNAYTSPQPSTQPLTEFPQMDSGLVVHVFNQGDDLIACLNKAMAFLIIVASSRFPSTNNQLRTSFNPRNQATIQDGRVIVQQVQRRQGQSYAGEAHMARQCTQPKRHRNVAWFKEKAMLAKA
ncbi:hypothetical protein Tco_0393318 [Tanacetum coccineum]